MRTPLLVLAIALGLSAPADAVKLEAVAAVQLVDQADARLDHWTANAGPAWTVTGAPAERLQLFLELQTADGRRLTADRGESLVLDLDGRLLTTLSAPASSPHDAIDVLTLVVCRE